MLAIETASRPALYPRRQLPNELVDGKKQLVKRGGSEFLQALPVAVQHHPLHQAY